MKIAVLCGGISTEREISLRTSVKAATALQQNGHDVVMIDVFFGESEEIGFEGKKDFAQKADALRAKNSQITDDLIEKTGLAGPGVVEICRQADIVFIGLHGKNGEDGRIQALFDKEGIKYTGSGSLASQIAMDKARTKELISPHIRMPRGISLKKGETASEKIPVPCVVKPCNGGSSVGVVIVRNEDEYENAVNEVFKYDDTILIEEYIKGRELTQGVIDGIAFPPVEIIPEADTWYDYTNKYSGQTKEVCPADIPDEVLKIMSETSLRFGQIAGLSVYYRIDYLLDDQGVLYALEANSLPGMTDTSLVPQEAGAVGIDYNSLCEMIIEKSLEKYI